MKKLILPLLFIFLAAAAFGQTKKEMPKNNAKEFKEVKLVKLAPKSVKHLKAAFKKYPSLSKYWKIDTQALKPKAGYGLLSNGKGQVVVCRTGSNGKANPDKIECGSYEKGNFIIHYRCECEGNVSSDEDDCFFYSNPQDPHNYGCTSPSGVCKCHEIQRITNKTTGVTSPPQKK